LSPARDNDLVIGLHQAIAVRARIQQATGAVMVDQQCTPEQAYAFLRVHAAQTGAALSDAATTMLPGVD
jgi:AmiR/NasT family two-component response regulator